MVQLNPLPTPFSEDKSFSPYNLNKAFSNYGFNSIDVNVQYYPNEQNYSLFEDKLKEQRILPTDFITKEPLDSDVSRVIITNLYMKDPSLKASVANIQDIDPQIVALENLGPNIKYDKDALLEAGKAVQITDSWGDTKTYCAVKSIPDLIQTFDKEQYNSRIEPINNYNDIVSLFSKEKQDQLYVSPYDQDPYTKIYQNLKTMCSDFLDTPAGKSLLKNAAYDMYGSITHGSTDVAVDNTKRELVVGMATQLIKQITPHDTTGPIPASALISKDLQTIYDHFNQVRTRESNNPWSRSNSDKIYDNFNKHVDAAFAGIANHLNKRAVFLEKQQEVIQQQQPQLAEPKGFVQNVKLAYDKLANNINAVAEKFANKFDFTVQALSKTRLALTTKNLAIEQSKDRQQTVQPQKNTPEVKQQSKAKDMER